MNVLLEKSYSLYSMALWGLMRLYAVDRGLCCKAYGQRLADTIRKLGIADAVCMDLELARPLLRGNLTQALPHVGGTQEGREPNKVLSDPSLEVRLLILLGMIKCLDRIQIRDVIRQRVGELGSPNAVCCIGKVYWSDPDGLLQLGCRNNLLQALKLDCCFQEMERDGLDRELSRKLALSYGGMGKRGDLAGLILLVALMDQAPVKKVLASVKKTWILLMLLTDLTTPG